MANQGVVDKLKIAIEKVGFPLEVAARRIIDKNDYSIYSDRYYSQINPTTKEESWREIDIYAEKIFPSLKIGESEILFSVNLIAECKYSSTNDFFAFETDYVNDWGFPPLFGSGNLFAPLPDKHAFAHFFPFPITIHNIAEVDVGSMTFHTSDRTIYEAANQLANAVAYFANVIDDEHSALYEHYEEEEQTISKYKTYVRKLRDEMNLA